MECTSFQNETRSLPRTKKKEGIEKEEIHLYSGVSGYARAKRGVSITVHRMISKHIKNWNEIDNNYENDEFYGKLTTVLILGELSGTEDNNMP